MSYQYSYQVELRRIEAEIAGLELDLAKNTGNERAKELLDMKRKGRAWLLDRISKGLDPGMRTL